VEAWVHSPLLPASVAGTSYYGMMHASDWYVTFVVGIGGGAFPDNTGPRPPDGHNMWPAITGSNLTSPRTEVIHAVQNMHFNSSGGNCPGCPRNVGVASARFGDLKIILGASCAGAKVVAWPEPSTEAVPFGKTTGWVRNGTNWAYAGLLKGVDRGTGAAVTDDDTSASAGEHFLQEQHGSAEFHARAHTSGVLSGDVGSSPDPNCSTGLVCKNGEYGTLCALASCHECGCPGGVPHGPGGKEGCCLEEIAAAKKPCSKYPPPCTLDPAPPAQEG
jgi:hypothetical protein